MDRQDSVQRLTAMADQWDRCAANAAPTTHRQGSRTDEYRRYAQACRDKARALQESADTAPPTLNHTVTYAPDGAGHWAGPAYITHHTYGEQAHRTRADADRWNAAQRAIRPAPDARD